MSRNRQKERSPGRAWGVDRGRGMKPFGGHSLGHLRVCNSTAQRKNRCEISARTKKGHLQIQRGHCPAMFPDSQVPEHRPNSGTVVCKLGLTAEMPYFSSLRLSPASAGLSLGTKE